MFGCLSHSLDNQDRVGSLEGHYSHPDSTGEVNLEHTDIHTGLSAYIHTNIQTYPDKHADIHTGLSAYIQTYPDKHADIHSGISVIHTYRHTLTNTLIFTQVSVSVLVKGKAILCCWRQSKDVEHSTSATSRVVSVRACKNNRALIKFLGCGKK